VLSVADMMSSISNSYRLNNYISFGSDVVSQINDRRSRFNKTHLVSTNNLWNLGKNFDLTSQISYLHDRTESDSRSEVQYFLNDKTIATVAEEHDNERQNQLAADITLKANTAKLYIENKLSTDLKWNNLHSNITGTYPNRQFGELPYRKVADDIELMMKDTLVETNLSNLSQTATLAITPSKTWYFKLKCEHYYNEINADVKKTLVLADADFTYCFKGGWEVNLAVTNIFDQQHYAYRSYNGTMSLYQSYKIRPRNVLASVYFRF
jgi:hypothetical protein